MLKTGISTVLVVGALSLGGCAITDTTYSPGYGNDYVSSVGYYGYQPSYRNYWGYYDTRYNSGMGYGHRNYWSGGPGWYGRGWR